MTELGERLDKAKNTFDGAMGKLGQRKGNLIRQVERMRILGAKASKTIPGPILEESVPDRLTLAEPADSVPRLHAIEQADENCRLNDRDYTIAEFAAVSVRRCLRVASKMLKLEDL